MADGADQAYQMAYRKAYQAYALLRQAYVIMREVREEAADVTGDIDGVYLYAADTAALHAALVVLQGHFNNNLVPDEELIEIAYVMDPDYDVEGDQ